MWEKQSPGKDRTYSSRKMKGEVVYKGCLRTQLELKFREKGKKIYATKESLE